jgi:molybdopterin-guanine dinucleotide biosynthesis protein A
MAIQPHSIGAIVLCGGQSRRMGHDKATMISPDGRPLLSMLLDRLATAVAPQHTVVAARCGQTLPPVAAAIRVVHDCESDQGPLAGIVAGLAALEGQVELALVLAGDSPRFAPAVVPLLAQHMADGAAVVPQLDGRIYPLTALYRTAAAAEKARQCYDQGVRRVVDWTMSLSPVLLGEALLRTADPTLASFAPCNTPQEFAQLLGE